MSYRPDDVREPADLFLLAQAGPEPTFDAVTSDFLMESYRDLKQKATAGSLIEAASLAPTVPWLYRLSFRTRGLVRALDGEVQPIDRHVIALRFLPDYLRRADRFEMLRYLEPGSPYHPNVCPHTGAICVEVYPGEPLLEIVHSLHDLLRWRLRQLAEQDALNRDACGYGRDMINGPLDDRPLFPRRVDRLELEPVESTT